MFLKDMTKTQMNAFVKRLEEKHAQVQNLDAPAMPSGVSSTESTPVVAPTSTEELLEAARTRGSQASYYIYIYIYIFVRLATATTYHLLSSHSSTP